MPATSAACTGPGWSGLAQEEYDPYIAPLIARCAAVLASLALLHYDPQAPDWPAGQVQQLADFVGQAWDAYVRSLTQEDLIHATAQHLVQMLRADGRAVPDALLDLARVQR
jgi:hypothetical protein